MAIESDILFQEFRARSINEILGSENVKRKELSFKRLEIYKMNLDPYLKHALKNEYAEDTVKEMRKVSSINPSKRIVKEMASIYKHAPKRRFSEVSDQQEPILIDQYRAAHANSILKKANRYFKLLGQCALQVIPKNGIAKIRVYAPHQYDVIPLQDEPEKALAYVLNVMDRPPAFTGDGIDQVIADKDDFQKRAKMRFIWWSANYNFITDGLGVYLPDETDPEDIQGAVNPIGILPFIDLSGDEKDSEFWSREGSPISDFAIDFAVLLSDTATVNRNQGFSQGIFSSVDKPSSIEVGRQRVLWLKQNPDPGSKDSSFAFATPSPDLSASLMFLENTLKYWLTCQGLDPKTVSGSGEAKSFSSGLERLLSMIEKFEASQDDIELFKGVEDDLFNLIKLWNATGLLNQSTNLSDSSYVDVSFSTPQMVQTKNEREDSAIKLKDAGLIDEVDAVMTLDEVDEEKAIEFIVERKLRKLRVERMVEQKMIEEGFTPPAPPVEALPIELEVEDVES